MRLLILTIILPIIVFKVGALNVVTTFPSLEEDVKLIAPNDSIYAISAFSHDYELTPKDVEMLKKADIVISTAHTHFEIRIAEMKKRGEIKGVLFEIPKIRSIALLKYPESGKVNPHMPIYDPHNYEVFITALAEELQKLNPSENYVERAKKVCKEVEEIVKKAKKLNGTALVDYPYAQYAVTWIGLRVVGIVFEAPTTLETFKKVDYLVLTRNSTKSEKLLENVECSKVIYVDSPFVKKSIPEKLKDIEIVCKPKKTLLFSYSTLGNWFATIILVSAMYGLISPIVYARKLQFLSTASSHSALLAVLLSIPLSAYLPSYISAILIGLVLIYSVGYAINRGVEPNTATSILVSFTASTSVLAMFFVITHYEIATDIWAMILGDPLLVTWSDLKFLSVVTAFVILTIALTYREQFHIGFDRDCATLAGINVRLYDLAFYTVLGISTVAMLKVVGFVLQHVLILLPCAIAMKFAKGSKGLIVYSVTISVIASIVGLAISIALNLSPSGVIGLVMFTFCFVGWLK